MIVIPDALLNRQVLQGNLDGRSVSPDDNGKAIISVELPREYACPWLLHFYSPAGTDGGDATVDRNGDFLILPATPVGLPLLANAIIFLTVQGEQFAVDYPARGAVYQIVAHSFQVSIRDNRGGSTNNDSYKVDVLPAGYAWHAPPTIERMRRTITFPDVTFGASVFATVPRRAAAMTFSLNDSFNNSGTGAIRFFNGGGAQVASYIIGGGGGRNSPDVSQPIPIPATAQSFSAMNTAAAASWIAPQFAFYLSA